MSCLTCRKPVSCSCQTCWYLGAHVRLATRKGEDEPNHVAINQKHKAFLAAVMHVEWCYVRAPFKGCPMLQMSPLVLCWRGPCLKYLTSLCCDYAHIVRSSMRSPRWQQKTSNLHMIDAGFFRRQMSRRWWRMEVIFYWLKVVAVVVGVVVASPNHLWGWKWSKL